MKRITRVEKYVRENFRSLTGAFQNIAKEKQRTSDFGAGGRPQTVMLRERTWRIEVSRSKAKRFLSNHRIAVVATLAVLFTGIVTRYVLIGFASTADFYPSSCLGNWENVQNALGKPDLSPGSPASAFTTLNSAVFGTSSAQMFCGNFSGDTNIDLLTGKSFQGADLVLSWSVVFPQAAPSVSGAGGGDGPVADENSSTTDMANATSSASSTTSSTPADMSAAASDTTDVVTPAPATPAPTPPPQSASDTSVQQPAPPAGTGSDSVAAPTNTGSDGGNTTTPAPPTPPPAVTPPASDQTTPDTAPTSWLRTFVGVAYADETSSLATDVSASTTELAGSSTPVATTSSAQGETPTEPQPSPITVNTSVFQNIILPSSTADDALALVYSTDGVTWQPIANINSSNWQQGRYPIPITSWDELQHLQVAFVGLGASSSPQIFLDAAGVEVSYIDTPETTTVIASSTTPGDATAETAVNSGGEAGTPATSTWTPPVPPEDIIQKPTISETDVFQQGAHQQCVVAPFSETVAPGGSASFSLQLFSGIVASSVRAVYETQVGSLPVGVSATIMDGKTSNTSSTQSIHVTATASAPAGSYSVLIIYRERQDDASMRSTGCQMNVVVR